MKSTPSLTRREFLRRSLGTAGATLALPTLVPARVFGAPGQPAPNDRIQVGCIGVGPQGRGVMGNFLAQPTCRVVALCDLSGRNLGEAVKQVNGAYQDRAVQTLKDFRELVARKDLDAVLIATPDHWHVPVALAAARAGKDMYLEKPMGLAVAEDKRLRRACQQRKLIFQFGTQQRSSQQFRLACELVRNRKIGQLRHIDVWCAANRPGGSTAPIAAPGDLDYDFWLGPARETPYTLGKAYDENGAWKTWWHNYDYALGFIAGWGVHPLDIAYWGHPGLMAGPLEVSGRAVFPKEGACDTALAWHVDFRAADGVTMSFKGTPNNYDQASDLNDFKPWQQKYGKIVDHGTAFEGTEGWVVVDRTQIRTSPETLVETKLGASDTPLIRSGNHVRNFLDSIRSRQPAICPIEDSVQADILCHLSDLATRLPERLTWDPKAEQFVGHAAANAKLRLRPYRAPWKL